MNELKDQDKFIVENEFDIEQYYEIKEALFNIYKNGLTNLYVNLEADMMDYAIHKEDCIFVSEHNMKVNLTKGNIKLSLTVFVNDPEVVDILINNNNYITIFIDGNDVNSFKIGLLYIKYTNSNLKNIMES